MHGVRWEVLESPVSQVQELATSLKVSSVLAQLLWNRGLRDEASARVFLNCQLRDLADPFELQGMEAAVERLFQAIERKEKIALYGDYDVDGVSSVAILARFLQKFGAIQVCPFLPDRFDEGYGLTTAGIDRCLEQHQPQLVIVLDCGTNSCAEVDRLRKKGIDVIIVDHHEPSTPVEAVPLINYKLRSRGRADQTEYCTAGLAFKLCHGIVKTGRQRKLPQAEQIDLKGFLDLVALATVADIAPLTGENRILVRHGLRNMGKTDSVGLRALLRVAGVSDHPSGYDCGFRLGPRLNAAGRLESAMASLQLLLSDSEDDAHALAKQLDSMNRERQAEEARVLIEARAQAEVQAGENGTRVLVLSCPGWHEGVIGIVASRITREFHLPTFVIALNGSGMGKGSGRSIEGFNLAQAVEQTRALLVKGGGHAMAAGISLEDGQIEKWRKALQEQAQAQGLDGDRLKRVVRIDAEVKFSQMDMKLVSDLENLEPCGMGNPRPLFVSRKVQIAAEPRTVGGDGKHLKLFLRQEKVGLDAIAFGKGGIPLQKGDFVDVVHEIELNEYQGNRKLQLNVKEIAKASG
jgi:single-stranded-DNA-specific exonuclease